MKLNKNSCKEIHQVTESTSCRLHSLFQEAIMYPYEIILVGMIIVDSSIIFLGQLFYREKQLNQWEVRFVVVKHLEAFTSVRITNITTHPSLAVYYKIYYQLPIFFV